MDPMPDISHQRLVNQRIAPPAPARPEDVVRWMGFIQAQDYAGALWAVGLRTPDVTETEVEQAICEHQFVRTWPARGTLHFVAAQDVRWMLALLGPRAIRAAASRHRQLGLDEETFARSRKRVAQVLRGGNRMPRQELYQALDSAGIATEGQRGIHILGKLAQEGLICFGPRDGKQHVFLLLEEWLPEAPILPHDQALRELARRYFTSHGPATARDFAWWAGLAAADARAGLEMVQKDLTQVEVDGKTCWGPPPPSGKQEPVPAAHLLPAYEEYLLGYTDRSAVLEPKFAKQMITRNGMIRTIVVIDGQVVGVWSRVIKKGAVEIKPVWAAQPGETELQAVRQAAGRYGAFLGLEAVLRPGNQSG
jgi:DNA glycosylase AlkZ-like